VDECLRTVQAQAENRGIELTTSHLGGGVSLFADETALKQILLNILSNAIKYSPKGGPVRLRQALDGSLTLSVIDSGIGMTDEEIC
jgi:signal transduction histidine kinase